MSNDDLVILGLGALVIIVPFWQWLHDRRRLWLLSHSPNGFEVVTQTGESVYGASDVPLLGHNPENES